MVMSFFRKSQSGLEHISQQTISMLGDARHSFDLASTALLGGADPAGIRADIEATDERINMAEQRIRSELVVHVAVHGSDDIGTVLGYTLLIKKIERVGDQAKNVFELAADGVSLVGDDDIDELVAQRQAISLMYVQAAELLGSPDDDVAAKEFIARTHELNSEFEQRILEFMHSDEPGRWAVPRAILFRYWKRIVANLGGIVTASIEPVQHIDYEDDGKTDIDD